MNPCKANSPCHMHHFWLLALYVHIRQVQCTLYGASQGEWIYMIVEDLTLHCFSTSIENLEQAMQVSGWDTCTHTSTCTRTYTCMHLYIHTCRNTQREIMFLCCPALCNVSLCPSPSLSGARLQWVGWAALWGMCAGAQQGCDCTS